MNMLIHKPRLALLAVLTMTAASTVAIAAESQITEHVIVEAGRPTAKVVGRSATGAPIEEVSLSARVTYSDLELSIPSNAKVFKQRVHDAAREVCDRLEQMYPLGGGSDSCVRKAEEGAQPQVTAAIAKAESRKSASDQ